MQVFVNGVEQVLKGQLPEKVGEILEQLRGELSKKKMIIRAISVDGQVLERDLQVVGQTCERLLSEVKLIELTVEKSRDLLLKGLTNSRDLLQSLRKEFIKIATSFRLGDEDARLASCLDDLQTAMVGMKAASQLPGVESETESLRQLFIATNSRLAPVLDTIHKAQEAGDYVVIADGLEYDLTEIADEWIGVLNQTLTSITAEVDTAAQET